MTNAQKRYKIGLIRQVHTSKLYNSVYKNDRELYEDMLSNSFGVTSSKELSIEELIKLVEFLEQKALNIYVPKASDNQMHFIQTLWKANATFKEYSYMIKFINKRVIKREVSSLKELHKREVAGVIGAIKKLTPLQAVNN